MKSCVLLSVAMLTVLSAVAKPSVSKVSAKINGGNLVLSYTLSEKKYNPEESCRYVEAQLFASQADATSYFNACYKGGESEADPIAWLDFEDEDAFENGKHEATYSVEDYLGLTVKELKAECPNAVLAIIAGDECDEDYSLTTARVDFSAASAASPLALSLYKKAQTLTGVCETEDGYSGTVTLKLGAINKKTAKVKVTATYASFAGKKLTASQTIEADEEGWLYGSLVFRGFGGEGHLSIGPDEESEDGMSLTFELGDEDGTYEMRKAQVGGTLEAESLCFGQMIEEELELSEGYEWLDISPDGMDITVDRGTKWLLARSPTIKYTRFREDGDTWYELTGLDDENKPNVSSLKLTYTAKTGTFKGSYYLYASNECCIDYGRSPKLVKYKVTVSGVMIDGIGYGSASMKIGKTSYTWGVVVE